MTEDRKDSKAFDGTNIESLPRWLRDLIDYQNESAGRETGRIKRFVADDRSEATTSEKKKKERAFSELMRRLQDPHYARLYSSAVDAVARADKAIGAALAEIETETEVALQRLERLRQSAAELPDGTKIFQSRRSGQWYAEDGRDLTDQASAARGLDRAGPSLEEYKEAQEKLGDLEIERAEIEAYRRDVVNPSKERLGDTKNPPSEDELEEITNMESTLPARAQKFLNSPEPGTTNAGKKPVADDVTGPASLNAPDMSGAFKTAREDAYASSSATPLPTSVPKPS